MKGPLLKSALAVIGVYIFFKFILPLFTAPLPGSLINLYLRDCAAESRKLRMSWTR